MTTGQYVDIGCIVLLLIAFLVGKKKGIALMIGSKILGILCIAIATAAVIFGLKYVLELDLYATLCDKLNSLFTQEIFTTQIDLTLDVAEGQVLIQSAMDSGSGFFSIFKPIANVIFNGMVKHGTDTVGAFLSEIIVKVLIIAVIWLVVFIIFKLIFNKIDQAVLKTTKKKGFLRVLDKSLGVVWSLAMVYLVVVVVLLTAVELAVTKFLPDKIDVVTGFISSSKVLSLAHNTNFVGNFIAEKLSITLPDLPVSP